ncbi:AraC family transcriptional regulator [Paenibacillus sp. DYY-L-2]|uniref:AraC family transcriptional regulator n=1 Tax=Paenibacillus sp. DYY-L-2 TaxID=3447013 RepID=UPI003F4FB2FC
MDMLKNMNLAMGYIEECLTEEIDMNRVARLAGCSEYHFTRMFSFLAGIPLSEYIRRRRLTLAASDLKQTGMRVIDIALKYGYQSPDSFARAFIHLHGMSPSEARSPDALIKAYPQMTFQLTIKGGHEMKYRIEEKEEFRIIGLMRRVSIVFEGVNPEIASMWESLDENRIAALKRLSNIQPSGLISASTNFSEGRMEEKGGLDHYIGVATTLPCPEEPGLAALEVPASTWAVFEAVGPFPETLQNVWGRIYSEWLPSTGFELAEGPEILWNEQKDVGIPDFKSEIWIPVLRKKSMA